MSSTVMPSFLVAFFITFSIIPLIITVVRRSNILDEPGGRKIHTEKIPAFGGVAIFLGFVVTLLVWVPVDQIKNFKYVLAGIMFMVFVGMRDDLLALRPLYKLFGQIIASAIVIHWGGTYLTSFHGLFGVYEVPLWLGYAITMLLYLTLTNAFNLIDGIDGLAGTVAMTVFVSLGVYFYFSGQEFFLIICSGIAASVLAFLKFNYSPAKIFMGDTGSLLIGFLSAVLLVKFLETNATLPLDHVAKIVCPLSVALCMVAYPIVDLVRVFVLRVLQRRSPFSPDQNHLHHLVLRLRLSHVKSTLLISFINSCFILLAFCVRGFNDLYVMPSIILSFVLLGLALDYSISLAYPKKTKKKNKIFD